MVDVHSHYLPAALIEALGARSELPRISERDGKRLIEYGEGNVHPMLPAMTDLELRMADMDAQGIDVAVLAVVVPGIDWFPRAEGPAVARAVNDELSDVVASRPDRLAALAALPMQDPEAAAAELERAAGMGLRGATIYSNVAGRGLHEPEFRVVFETAARLDVALFLHPTFPLVARALEAYALIPTLGFLVDTTNAVLRLVIEGLYERHPELKLVIAHTGSLIPQLVGRIDYEYARDPDGRGKPLGVPPSEHLRLLYTDAVCVWPPALRSTLDFLGPERVMYGSDYPFWDPARTSETIDATGLPADTVGRLLGENAAAVFRLDAPVGAA